MPEVFDKEAKKKKKPESDHPLGASSIRSFPFSLIFSFPKITRAGTSRENNGENVRGATHDLAFGLQIPWAKIWQISEERVMTNI